MSLKIFTFTLMLIMFLSPAPMFLNAQENETDTNSSIPLPPLNLNATSTETNSTDLDVNGTESGGEPVDYTLLARIREMAQNRTTEMMLLFGNGTYSPDIMNELTQAQQAMEKAMEFEGVNTQAAAQQYLRALKQYRNALMKALKDNPDFLTEFEEPEVNGTASDDVNATVTEAEISLAKTQLINEFEERFQEQITAMLQNADDLSGEMSPQDALKVQMALTKAEQKLLRIQERILNGQYDEALEDLDNATSTLGEELDDVDDPGTAQMLRTMNHLEAKIQKIEQRAEKKASRGLNTDEEDSQLAELRGNRDHTKNDYKENRGNSNGKGGGKPDNTGKPDKDHPNKGKGNN